MDTQRIVGISEYAATDDASQTLVTYSLGSCVGLSLYDPVASVGGILHAMMPSSNLDPRRAAENPAMFADTGTVAMLRALFDMGATRKTLVAKLAGAASPIDQQGRFRVGERNQMVVRRLLWKNDILLAAEDCGGILSRTLMLEMSTGRTLVKSNGVVHELK